ncbi:hypothetical protein [Geoalkalibacter sp.]|uniref:hypothetical protein n=1 Tax=Geoalkalibacter sp. TaxID=3041440 RepID=UPI00272EA761|nr:hypothetical protein [Geoalkalibacter sp.]
MNTQFHANGFTRIAIVCLLALLLLLAGCGRSEETSPGGSAASDQPVKGQALSKAGQITGIWFRMTEGDLFGIEFLKDNKALVTLEVQVALRGSSGIMVSYNILEGGRLSLTTPDGETIIYDTSLAGDQLELRSQRGVQATEVQRFRRLKPGQTLAQAFEEEKVAKALARKKRIEALDAFFSQPGLVLGVRDPQPTSPPMLALILGETDTGMPAGSQPSGGFSGKAVHDNSPPVLARIEGALVENRTGDFQLNVQLGQQLEPVTTRPSATQGQFVLEISGDDKRPQIAGRVSYGQGRDFELELRQDQKMHAQIVKKFKDEKMRVAALQESINSLLKDYALLSGRSASPLQHEPNGSSDQILLLRDERSGNLGGEITVTNNHTGSLQILPISRASIMVEGDKALLLLEAIGRQYTLERDSATGQFTGYWAQGINLPGYAATLELAEALDRAALNERLDAQRKALARISPEDVFQGFIPHWPNREPNPVSLKLNIDQSGAVQASAFYPMFKSTVTFKGQVRESASGPFIELRFLDIPASPGARISTNMFSMQIRNQVWELRVSDGGSSPQLAGRLKLGGSGSFELKQSDEQWQALQRTLYHEALNESRRFIMVHPDPGRREPAYIELKLDAASQRISGVYLNPGVRMTGVTDMRRAVSGDLRDMEGWLVLHLTMEQPVGARNRTTDEMDLLVRRHEDKILLNGVEYPTPTGSHSPRIDYVELAYALP